MPPFKSISLTVCLTAVLVSASANAQETHNHNATGGKVYLLPRELEMKLAVNALPKSLRDDASVLVLESGSYVQVKKGTNPFTCIVSRRGGNLYPVCFDAEGARTILPEYMDDATMRLKGASNEEVDRQIAGRFADGRYQPPAKPGIAYMLSPVIYMMADGKLVRNTPPHTMFYAPYLTDADVGGVMGKTPFIDRPGPHGMFIVVAGQKEREAFTTEGKELLDQVELEIARQSQMNP